MALATVTLARVHALRSDLHMFTPWCVLASFAVFVAENHLASAVLTRRVFSADVAPLKTRWYAMKESSAWRSLFLANRAFIHAILWGCLLCVFHARARHAWNTRATPRCFHAATQPTSASSRYADTVSASCDQARHADLSLAWACLRTMRSATSRPRRLDAASAYHARVHAIIRRVRRLAASASPLLIRLESFDFSPRRVSSRQARSAPSALRSRTLARWFSTLRLATTVPRYHATKHLAPHRARCRQAHCHALTSSTRSRALTLAASRHRRDHRRASAVSRRVVARASSARSTSSLYVTPRFISRQTLSAIFARHRVVLRA